MQQYYTLEEAAKVLQMTPDDLREMAKKKQVRAFQDRGTWRFRMQDIQEMARERGIGSEPELKLGDAAKAAKRPADSDLLPVDFALEDKPSDSGRGGKSSSKSSGKHGSDSDVRLVPEESRGDPDSDVRLDETKPSSSKRKKGEDSSVRLVPPEAPVNDSSVVQLGDKRPSDSDIRLHDMPSSRKRDREPGVITEEIDLDAEEAKARESGKLPRKGRATQHAKSPETAANSPFELSESDVKLKPAGKSKPGEKAKTPDKKKGDSDSSSDFELIPFDSTKAPPDLGSGEIPLLDDDNVSLGSEIRPGKGNSGINLNDPADSGISLEGSGEVDFELSLGGAAQEKKKQKKAKGQSADDSSSEFELSLDDSPSDPSDSEFELNLDDSGADLPAGESSDSEFELTLDDEGALAAVDDDAKDIFEETNFDVPALDDESGSEAVALDESDTDMEGSDDFEISLDDSSEGPSKTGSQVVPLDDDADDAAATVARPRKVASKLGKGAKKPVSDEDLEFELEESGPKKKPKKRVVEEDEDEEEEEALVPAGPAPAAEWGVMPALVLFPTVIVMFLVGLMGFELTRSMWGYQQSTKVATPIVDQFKKLAD